MFLCASGDRESKLTCTGPESADQWHGGIADDQLYQFNSDTGVTTARRLQENDFFICWQHWLKIDIDIIIDQRYFLKLFTWNETLVEW